MDATPFVKNKERKESFLSFMYVNQGLIPKVTLFFLFFTLIERINYDKMMVFQKGIFDWR